MYGDSRQRRLPTASDHARRWPVCRSRRVSGLHVSVSRNCGIWKVGIRSLQLPLECLSEGGQGLSAASNSRQARLFVYLSHYKSITSRLFSLIAEPSCLRHGQISIRPRFGEKLVEVGCNNKVHRSGIIIGLQAFLDCTLQV